MKKILFAAMALGVLTSCKGLKVSYSDNEPGVNQRRELTGFERIEQLGSLDVKYQQADTFSVYVNAPSDILKHVETRVDANKLIVHMKGDGKVINLGVKDGDDVTVYVTSPDLIGIDLKGSGDFDCKGHLDTDRLDISLNGSGDVEFDDVICDDIDVSLVGSGDVEVKQVQTLRSRVNLVGSGDVSMRFVNSGDVEAKLLGSGDIKLKGDVRRSKYEKRGSGDIEVRELRVSNP